MSRRREQGICDFDLELLISAVGGRGWPCAVGPAAICSVVCARRLARGRGVKEF